MLNSVGKVGWKRRWWLLPRRNPVHKTRRRAPSIELCPRERLVSERAGRWERVHLHTGIPPLERVPYRLGDAPIKSRKPFDAFRLGVWSILSAGISQAILLLGDSSYPLESKWRRNSIKFWEVIEFVVQLWNISPRILTRIGKRIAFQLILKCKCISRNHTESTFMQMTDSFLSRPNVNPWKNLHNRTSARRELQSSNLKCLS